MPHGRHIYSKASYMANATLCTYPQSGHALPHWKCVLQCCADCPCINIPDQEKTKNHEETTPSIRFHIYHIIGRCTAHGRIAFKDCSSHITTVISTKYAHIWQMKGQFLDGRYVETGMKIIYFCLHHHQLFLMYICKFIW